MAATAAAAGAGIAVAPIILISGFGNTVSALFLYVAAVAAIIHAGTMLIRPYMAQPNRGGAWLRSIAGTLATSILVFGWAFAALSDEENLLPKRGDPALPGWDVADLWEVVGGGFGIGLAVSFIGYWRLTRPATAVSNET